MPSYGRALHQASVVLAQVPGGVNKQGSTLSGKWRSLAGLLPGGGLKAGPPLDPPRPSIISLFHPPGVRGGVALGAPGYRVPGTGMSVSLREEEASFVVRVQYGVGLRPSFYIGSL